ncbi:hypothetical protein [Pseudomonas viridiflava]|uniref:hypothetical protein n=1 Tax=Pseudomonas viridiflava TaxID=33069 RepID=UPI0013CEA4BA|nr:hypothetical protein [Pseudomonas viridiflava]
MSLNALTQILRNTHAVQVAVTTAAAMLDSANADAAQKQAEADAAALLDAANASPEAAAAAAAAQQIAADATAAATAAAAALLDAANNNSDTADIVFSEEMRLDATRVIREWAETDDLDTDEGYGDRLLALIVGTAAHSDTDLTEDEVEYAGMVAELVGDILEKKGIPGDDIDALFADGTFDNEVGERVYELLLDKMPQGEDAVLDDAGKFVDGEDDDNMLDATYRKVIAIRKGKKVRLNKRIAGTVRLNAKQKAAVRKMQRKAFSGGAKIKRAKSMRLRRKMGM